MPRQHINEKKAENQQKDADKTGHWKIGEKGGGGPAAPSVPQHLSPVRQGDEGAGVPGLQGGRPPYKGAHLQKVREAHQQRAGGVLPRLQPHPPLL